MLGDEEELRDRYPRLGDGRLAGDFGAIDERRFELDGVERRGHDATFDLQDATRLVDRLIEAPGNGGHRREKEIAERVSGEPSALRETIAEELGHERLVVGERDQTIPNIAGRQDAELFVETARASRRRR